MILADKIIDLRKKNGWSQEELAEQLGVTRQSVSKWEGAQSVPDLERILQMARVFGVSTDYLLKDELEAEEHVPAQEAAPLRRVSLEEASRFLAVKAQTAGRIAAAVFLCILGAAFLILMTALTVTEPPLLSENAAAGVGMIGLIVLVAIAVVRFLACGARTRDFEYLEKEVFETAYGVEGMVRQSREQFRATYDRFNILGTALCILSVLPIIACALLSGNEALMVALVSLTLLVAGVGVTFFIRAGIPWASMDKLLQQGDYSRERKRRGGVAEAVGTIYWLLVTAAYLALSFTTNDWQRSWIVWPIAGVVFAAVTVAMAALHKRG